MNKKFKNKLKGKRIILKRTKPDIKTAKTMFKMVCLNRKHLRPWFAWEKLTLKIEDTLKYLFDKEKDFEKDKIIEYGIYLKDKYLGNIAMFDIDYKNKSAEIGYWLSSKDTRKGIMSESVKIIEKEFFKNFGLNRIQIRCDKENKASAGVAIKCKYKLEGEIRKDKYSEHFKNFRNTLIFSKLKSEFKS